MNYLYTSSILQSPVLAYRLGLRPFRNGSSHDFFIGCADASVNPAGDSGFRDGETHVKREGGAFIDRQRRSIRRLFNELTESGTKARYNYWFAAHTDCKFEGGLVRDVKSPELGVQEEVVGDLQEMFGPEYAEIIANAVRKSELQGNDLIDATSSLMALASALNAATYSSVSRHYQQHVANIVPMVKVFERPDQPGGEFPHKRYCLYDPQKVAFCEVNKEDNWVSRIESGDRKRPLKEILREETSKFAARIAVSDKNLIIHA